MLGNAARLAGLLVIGATLALTGCSTYHVHLQADSRINSFGLPPSDESGGRLLRIAVIAVDDETYQRLADDETVRGQTSAGDAGPWTWKLTQRWFDGLGDKIRDLARQNDTVWQAPLQPGQTLDVAVRHPAPLGGNAGILVLADFSGLNDETKDRFQSVIWRPTRWGGHDYTVRVGETMIEWAD